MIAYKTVSLADQVFDKLEVDILSGKYPRGSVLTEVGLSEDLGVSRTPIREALRRLEQEHLIESSGKGLTVIGITAKDVLDIYDIRELIEGRAAAECANNITDEQLRELTETVELQEFYAEKRDTEKVKEFDSRFHTMIYQYTGSTVYYDTLTPLHKKVQKVRKQSVEDRSRAKASSSEHREILSAIAAHNPQKASQAMLTHIQKAKNHLIELHALE